jgi:hypothetical protein
MIRGTLEQREAAIQAIVQREMGTCIDRLRGLLVNAKCEIQGFFPFDKLRVRMTTSVGWERVRCCVEKGGEVSVVGF